MSTLASLVKPSSSKSTLEVLQRQKNRASRGLPDLGRVQAKLTIGGAADPLEREADRAAEQVVGNARHPFPTVISGTANAAERIQRQCDGCSEEEEPVRLSRKQRSGDSTNFLVPPLFSARIQRERQGGRPMEPLTRSFMEKGFAADFSRVKFHDDAAAADLTRQVNARAFTVGGDVFFNHGELRPSQSEGRRLIAHELAHVVQQGGRGEVLRRTTLNCYASGYRWEPNVLAPPKLNPFNKATAVAYSRHAETVAVHEGKKSPDKFLWTPTTPDFEAIAKNASGRALPVGDLWDVIMDVFAEADRSISRLRIIGHGLRNGALLSMRGTVGLSYRTNTDPLVISDEEATVQNLVINGSGADAEMIDGIITGFPNIVEGVRARFKKGASVTLFACNTALKGEIACALQRLFQVPVLAPDMEVGICAPVIKDGSPPKATSAKPSSGSLIDETTRGRGVGVDALKMNANCKRSNLDKIEGGLLKFTKTICGKLEVDSD